MYISSKKTEYLVDKKEIILAHHVDFSIIV